MQSTIRCVRFDRDRSSFPCSVSRFMNKIVRCKYVEISSFDYYSGDFVIPENEVGMRKEVDWRNLEIHSKICDFHLSKTLKLRLHLHQEKNYLSFAPSLVRVFLLNWWTYHVYSIKLSLSTLLGDKTITIHCHTMNICEADKAGGQASWKGREREKNRTENLQMKNEQEQDTTARRYSNEPKRMYNRQFVEMK